MQQRTVRLGMSWGLPAIHRQPNEGRTRRFRRRLAFLNILVEDSVIGTIQALKAIMVDRVKWKKTHRNTLFFSSQLFMTCVKETVANHQQDEPKYCFEGRLSEFNTQRK